MMRIICPSGTDLGALIFDIARVVLAVAFFILMGWIGFRKLLRQSFMKSLVIPRVRAGFRIYEWHCFNHIYNYSKNVNICQCGYGCILVS